MSKSLHARQTALITGGASGLGRATAILLGREGARVCVADLDGPGAEKVAQQIKDSGGEAVTCVGDVASVDGNEAMVAKTVDAFGALDVAYLNAGIARGSTIRGGEMDEDMQKQLFEQLSAGVPESGSEWKRTTPARADRASTRASSQGVSRESSRSPN